MGVVIPHGLAIYRAQVSVLALSTFMYLLVILSYVDPAVLVAEAESRKDAEKGADGRISVVARVSPDGRFLPGHLVKYSTANPSAGTVSIQSSSDDDKEGKELHCELAEKDIEIVYPSRGLLLEIIGTLYWSFFSCLDKTGGKHIVNLRTELTMLSFQRESGLEENRLERVRSLIPFLLFLLHDVSLLLL